MRPRGAGLGGWAKRTWGEGAGGDEARIDFITHTATERDVQATLAELRELPVVDAIGGLIRVIGAG